MSEEREYYFAVDIHLDCATLGYNLHYQSSTKIKEAYNDFIEKARLEAANRGGSVDWKSFTYVMLDGPEVEMAKCLGKDGGLPWV